MNEAPTPLRTAEMLRRTPVGDSLYLEIAAPVISSAAAQAGVKVTTARFLALHPHTKEVVELTRVTVLVGVEPLETPAQVSRAAYPRRSRAVA